MGQPIYIPRFSIEEYETWPGSWELWNGHPVAMAPPSRLHQRMSLKLARVLATQLEEQACRCEVLLEAGFRLDEETVVVPDLLVVCDGKDDDYVTDDPPVVIELLSASTEERDRLPKRAMYAAAGVRHYFLVDPRPEAAGARFQCLRLAGGQYRERHEAGPIEFEPHAGCRLRIDPSDFD